MNNKSGKSWLFFALVTAVFWGVWGAFIELPEKQGFPATLGYVVWAVTMIPGGIFVLIRTGGNLDTDLRSIILGLTAGILGCAGQLVLFEALKTGPAYLVFPFISTAPVITIILSRLFLKEGASPRAWTGIVIAVVAIFLLSYQPKGNTVVTGHTWIILSLLVAAAWGIQAFVLKSANNTMKAESLIVYTVIAAIALAPLAVWLTDFSSPVNWGFNGPYLAAMIQFLNAIGFLTLVYAFRYGKAIIVSPMVNAVPPVFTVIISLALYRVIPHFLIVTGMAMAVTGAFLMATEQEEK
jgi:drug/metabolite transporter (DMT)-like permease